MEDIIKKILEGSKPLSELRADINRKAENLTKEQLLLLSPLLREVNSHNKSMSVKDLLNKADRIKKEIKRVEDASTNHNNKS